MKTESARVTDPPFVSVEGLADSLAVRVTTVREWCREVGPHSVPRYKLGRRLVFDVHEVTDWIKTTKDVRIFPRDRRRRRAR